MAVSGALAQAMREALRDGTTLEELHAAVYAAYVAVDVDGQHATCPVCNEPIDYCQGHGEIGDPVGHDLLRQHDERLDGHA